MQFFRFICSSNLELGFIKADPNLLYFNYVLNYYPKCHIPWKWSPILLRQVCETDRWSIMIVILDKLAGKMSNKSWFNWKQMVHSVDCWSVPPNNRWSIKSINWDTSDFHWTHMKLRSNLNHSTNSHQLLWQTILYSLVVWQLKQVNISYSCYWATAKYLFGLLFMYYCNLNTSQWLFSLFTEFNPLLSINNALTYFTLYNLCRAVAES